MLYLAIAHRAWGVAHRLAGEWPAAQARLDQAMALFESLETRWQLGRTLFELGQLAQAQDQPARAREHFKAAMRAFEILRAAPDAARVQAALAGLPST
jgi:hypothetical protein